MALTGSAVRAIGLPVDGRGKLSYAGGWIHPLPLRGGGGPADRWRAAFQVGLAVGERCSRSGWRRWAAFQARRAAASGVW